MEFLLVVSQLDGIENSGRDVWALNDLILSDAYFYAILLEVHGNAFKKEFYGFGATADGQSCLLSLSEVLETQSVEVLEHVYDNLGVFIDFENLFVVTFYHQMRQDLF